MLSRKMRFASLALISLLFVNCAQKPTIVVLPSDNTVQSAGVDPFVSPM
jgi:hypothetical protein